MSLTTIRHREGRHAAPSARLVATNRELVAEVRSLRTLLIDSEVRRQTEVEQIARVLGGQVRDLLDEQQAHARTKEALAIAVRANESNASATTCETDVTALRAAMADQYIESPKPKPAYRPYPRPAVRVTALWDAPFATTSPVWTPAAAA